MKKIIICLFATLSFSFTIANGDPVSRHSALIGSSNPTPKEITDVQLLSERLSIRPGKYSYISVKYVLWNNSDKDYIDIDYGFPVDYQGGGEKYVNSGLTPNYYSESSYTIGWQDNYIKEIEFYLDGKELPFKASTETVLSKTQLPDRKDFSTDKEGQEEYEANVENSIYKSVSRRWFYSQISIKKNQIVTLEVRYAIRNSSTSSAYESKKPTHASENNLVYDLSPARHWGDGTARDLFVEIDASDIATTPDYYNKTPYPKIQVEGLPFVRNGNIYSYRTNSFKFKDSKPILLNYTLMNAPDITEYLSERLDESKYKTSTTSQQSTYPATNLSDLNFATAWVATKGGIKEKIIIDFKEPTFIKGFAIINGYHKSKSTYNENNKIKTLSIRVGGSRGWDEFSNDPINDDINFKLTDYQPLYFENMRQHPDVYYYSIATYDRYKATRIELEIKDIYTGTKYNDTCISEIILFKGD